MTSAEEIKSKLDIIDVLRGYIPVKAVGASFKACCPFHREKTPSLVISPDKQVWHCFGCGKGGDIFSFVQEIEGLSFPEALRLLAPRAGVELHYDKSENRSERERLLEILSLARRYYRKVFTDSQSAQWARDYISGRGLEKDDTEEWQIGVSPDDWSRLSDFLIEKGYTRDEILKSGLATSGRDGKKTFDRFRDRVMFPINDSAGRTIAFSARMNPAKDGIDKMGKYINSPQNLLYDKSRVLFGLDKAKSEVRARSFVIVVEGQMDCISCHVHGWKNVVASSGTALTEDQIRQLKRLTDKIYFAFDMDRAGQLAADRGIREAMRQGFDIRLVILPEGKDPDDCLRRDEKLWQEAVEKARPVMEYYYEKVFKENDAHSIEGRRESARLLLPFIAGLADSVEQDYWLNRLSETLSVPYAGLRSAIQSLHREGKAIFSLKEESVSSAPQISVIKSKEERSSELILSLALRYPFLLEYLAKNLSPEMLRGKEIIDIYRLLIVYYNKISQISHSGDLPNQDNSFAFDYRHFRQWLEQPLEIGSERIQNSGDLSQIAVLDRLALSGEKDFYEVSQEGAKQEAIRLLVGLKRSYLQERLRDIEKWLATSEKEGDQDRINGLMADFKYFSDELRTLGSD